MARTVVIPAVAEQSYEEEIFAYTFRTDADHIIVQVGKGVTENDKFVFDKNIKMDTITISEQDYVDLMEENGGQGNPTPGKPKGHFRKDDLWPFIDRVRQRRNP